MYLTLGKVRENKLVVVGVGVGVGPRY